jgi:hypothetical protein
MNEENEWYRVLTLARNNAAQDLRLSNEILAKVDDLVRAAEKQELSEEKVSEISKALVEIALQLTDQSKKMSVSISKLVGAI